MTISNRMVITLAMALRELDGAGDTSYKFGPKTRYSLAKNLRILDGRKNDIDKARVGIIRELSGAEGKIAPDSEEMKVFQEKFNDLMEVEEDIPGLMRFQLSDLNLDVNPIPVSVLADLGPFIIEED